MTQALVVKGSIQDVAKGQDTAVALLDARLALICDRSSSMLEKAHNAKPRYVVEDEIVGRLQARYPGQIVIVSFSDYAELRPGGDLPYPSGTTDMADALRVVGELCGLGIKCVLISDGEPNDEQGTLHYVRQNKMRFDTIFVGPEDSGGADFLRRLAATANGAFHINDLANPDNLLEATIVHLLESGK